jgi:PIN domain
MNTLTRRYLFAAYSDLEILNFEHLEKVCDRLFILIPENTPAIPFALVRKLQRMGRGVKWIPVSENNGVSMPVQLSFLMGRLHQKLPSDIEFAILSDHETFDPLIQFILAKGRSCLRVRASKIEDETKSESLSDDLIPKNIPVVNNNSNPAIVVQPSKVNPMLNADADVNMMRYTPADALPDETTVRNTAQEVIERLVRSGNRPAEVNTLKQYIALTNQNMVPGVAEKVITLMAMNNDIQIVDKEVVYNF